MSVNTAEDMTDKIFLFQFRPAVAPRTIDTNEFIGVASASDITEYPEDTPDAPPANQYYRLSAIDLLFRNSDTLDLAVTIIQEDARDLINNLNIIDDQNASTPVVIIGDP
jgi:hypothetical protein